MTQSLSCVSLLSLMCCAASARADDIHKLLAGGQIEKAKALISKDPKLKDVRDEMRLTPLMSPPAKARSRS
jgi:hypothetical protein